VITQSRFYPDMSNVKKNITVEAKLSDYLRNYNNNNNNNNNKLFRTDCKKFYNRLRQTCPNVKNATDKEQV
jgi:hypothetical protein